MPSAHAALVGGPIIDAAVYGNKEFYPGQTAPLLVVVQNEGYLQSLSGVKTQESLISQSSQAVAADAAYSSSSTSSRNVGLYGFVKLQLPVVGKHEERGSERRRDRDECQQRVDFRESQPIVQQQLPDERRRRRGDQHAGQRAAGGHHGAGAGLPADARRLPGGGHHRRPRAGRLAAARRGRRRPQRVQRLQPRALPAHPVPGSGSTPTRSRATTSSRCYAPTSS